MVNAFKVLLAVASSASLIGGAFAAKTADITWYHPGILKNGACGVHNSDADLVLALNPVDFASGASCGRNVRVTYNGKTVDAKVVDLCARCGPGGVDLSPAAFQKLADVVKVDRIQADWSFV